ncbi:uncharacterized protein LOC111032134 [Myzus persicae]|uniref:uncharacterized protein LOC111032134 n=1 Tax=Myzus persicae TaxID=13164 RepID=UPI000B92FB75|nr:uncharacterized protein LOC111032134 [Myzus persicae]
MTLGKPAALLSTTKYGWNTFLAVLLASYLGLEIFSIWLWPPSKLDFGTVVRYFFEIPCVTEFAVFVTTYFYLRNLGSRFDTLNFVCEQFPPGLIGTAGTWPQPEITRLVDRARMLHSELCELLRVFGLGYGGVLLCYFAFNFVDLLRNFYYLLHVSRYNPSSDVGTNFYTLNVVLTVTFFLQNVVFVTCLLITVSWINEKKIEIVSFLRLIHISQLPIDTKLQVKMFMNQLSVFEWDQLTAFGFFRINLRFILSILILLTATLATSVQMKEHPYVIRFNNAYHSYLQFEYNMG